jgi:hypothetical protein
LLKPIVVGFHEVVIRHEKPVTQMVLITKDGIVDDDTVFEITIAVYTSEKV